MYMPDTDPELSLANRHPHWKIDEKQVKRFATVSHVYEAIMNARGLLP